MLPTPSLIDDGGLPIRTPQTLSRPREPVPSPKSQPLNAPRCCPRPHSQMMEDSQTELPKSSLSPKSQSPPPNRSLEFPNVQPSPLLKDDEGLPNRTPQTLSRPRELVPSPESQPLNAPRCFPRPHSQMMEDSQTELPKSSLGPESQSPPPNRSLKFPNVQPLPLLKDDEGLPNRTSQTLSRPRELVSFLESELQNAPRCCPHPHSQMMEDSQSELPKPSLGPES